MKIKNTRFIRKIFRNSEIRNIEDDIMLLGNTAKYSAAFFIFIRLLTTMVFFLILILIFHMGYIGATFLTILYYYLFYYVNMTMKIKRRGLKLDNEALPFFEILTLTLESGKNLENALEITCFNVESELSEEFKKTLFEIKFGKSLVEALESMKKRIPSESINNIILNITQTDIFGSRIIDTMYNQIEFLRDKRLLEIKGQINKIPNKISIVSLLFILPIILLLILGPIIINFLG